MHIESVKQSERSQKFVLRRQLIKIVTIDHSNLIWTNWKKGPLGTLKTKFEWFLVSGFIEEDFLRIGQKMHKITDNSIKNKGSTPILQIW